MVNIMPEHSEILPGNAAVIECDDDFFLDLGGAGGKIVISQTTLQGDEREEIEAEKYFEDFCDNCASGVTLINAFVPQPCPNCLYIILPCELCNHRECARCPLELVRNVMIERKPRRGTERRLQLARVRHQQPAEKTD